MARAGDNRRLALVHKMTSRISKPAQENAEDRYNASGTAIAVQLVNCEMGSPLSRRFLRVGGAANSPELAGPARRGEQRSTAMTGHATAPSHTAAVPPPTDARPAPDHHVGQAQRVSVMHWAIMLSILIASAWAFLGSIPE
jgi:hypothetical protein